MRSKAYSAAPRQEASCSVEATTGRPRASAMIWVQAGELSRPPPEATTSAGTPRPSNARARINLAKAQRNGFQRRVDDMERLGGEGEAGDGAAQIRAPIRRTLAREEWQKVQAVAPGSAVPVAPPCSCGMRQRALQPGVDFAAVGERSAQDRAMGVQTVAPQAGRNRAAEGEASARMAPVVPTMSENWSRRRQPLPM